MTRPWPVRVVTGHRYTFTASLIGLVALALLPGGLALSPRAVFAWDIGSISLLLMFGSLLVRPGDHASMARNAAAQQEGEWTVFGITLAAVLISFAALTDMLGSAKDLQGVTRKLYIVTGALTLFLSWLVTQVVFALRYAHEYYEREEGAAQVDGGLEFPGGGLPDYWDFLYFSLVLGMTFQVSDVQITSPKLRRLAAAQGLIGFLFNAVIIALTVNIGASLLS
jgi:uncharacterized membrane protein